MQAANLRDLDDLSGLGWLDASRHWAVHLQRRMGPPAEVAIEVASQDPSEVGFTEDGHMVQTLPPDATGPPFREGAIQRTSQRSRRAWRPPGRVGIRHPADQRSDLRGRRGARGPSRAARRRPGESSTQQAPSRASRVTLDGSGSTTRSRSPPGARVPGLRGSVGSWGVTPRQPRARSATALPPPRTSPEGRPQPHHEPALRHS